MTNIRTLKGRPRGPSSPSPLIDGVSSSVAGIREGRELLLRAQDLYRDMNKTSRFWTLITPDGKTFRHPDLLTLFIEAPHPYKPKE